MDNITQCERDALGYAEKLQEVRQKMVADPSYAQYLRPCLANVERALVRLPHANGGAQQGRVFDAVSRVIAVNGVNDQ